MLLNEHLILAYKSHNFLCLSIEDFLTEFLLSAQMLIDCLKLFALLGDSFGNHAELPANLVHIEVQLSPALLHDPDQIFHHSIEHWLNLLKSPKAVS